MMSDMTGESGIPGKLPNAEATLPGGLPEAPGSDLQGVDLLQGAWTPEPAVPGVCAHGLTAIDELRNPATTVVRLGQMRATLACPGCIQAFNTELKFRTTLTSAAWETPPPELSTRISAAMESMDLSSLDIGDFDF